MFNEVTYYYSTLILTVVERESIFFFCLLTVKIVREPCRRIVHAGILKDDRQRFLQKVSKKQFRTVYYNAHTCG